MNPRILLIATLMIFGAADAVHAQSRRSRRAIDARSPDLPRLGLQVTFDSWTSDPVDAPVVSGAGGGLRFETAAFGGEALRSFYVVGLHSLKKTNGGRTVAGDVNIGLTLAPRLNNGLTPYAGGGFGLTWGGAASGIMPVLTFGAQLSRTGKMPYVDVTWYAKDNRRLAVSVGMFL